jgi:hypothetical protein
VYAQGSPEEAVLSLKLSLVAYEGVKAWKPHVLNWNYETTNLLRRSNVAVVDLNKNVVGRTGSAEAEELALELRRGWQQIADDADWKLKNPPSTAEKAVAFVAQLTTDIVGAAIVNWQGIIRYATENAGPTVQSYWTSVSKVGILKADLLEARASGSVSREALDAQAVKLSQAEAKIQTIRDLYARLSGGGSLDQIAQDEHGPYQMSAGWVVPAVVIVVAITGLVLALGMFTGKLNAFGEKAINALKGAAKDPDTQKVIMVVAVVALAVVLAPYLMKD